MTEYARREPEQLETIPPGPPRRFGFGLGSVLAIVLGVAITVIASIVWFQPLDPSTAPKPQGYETPAAQ